MYNYVPLVLFYPSRVGPLGAVRSRSFYLGSSLGLGEHRLCLGNFCLGGSASLLRGRDLVLELGDGVGDALLKGAKDTLCLLDGGLLTGRKKRR